MADYSGMRIVVMGLGRFGGGLGVTRFLADRGADVVVTDLASEADLAGPLRELEPLIADGRVRTRLGEHNVSDFTTPDLVVANPAVPRPWDNRFLRAAQAAGVPITTELAIAIEHLPEGTSLAAVTGTAGKSTTSAMLAHALAAAGVTTHLGGNIGGSLLGVIDEITPNDAVVLEISSAQLHWLDDFAPSVAVITNLSGNHLDWHDTEDHYRRSKQKLLAHQLPGAAAVLGENVRDWPVNTGVERIIIDANRARAFGGIAGVTPAVPGEHNRRNAAAALAAAEAMLARTGHSTETAALERAIATFPGLPHRLAFVADIAGVRCYNDSKCTTPAAMALAVRALRDDATDCRGVRLIAGGYDKGSPASEFAPAMAECAGVYLIGATAEPLAKAARDAGSSHAVVADTLDAAVARALADAAPGEAVLLSPGCASWDQFTNYEARGEQFCQLVREAAARAASSPDTAPAH